MFILVTYLCLGILSDTVFLFTWITRKTGNREQVGSFWVIAIWPILIVQTLINRDE